MNRILAIGYGNPLRGDDGFGQAVAERLQQSLSQPHSVEFLMPIQLTPELAETLTGFDHVFFIDAAIGTQPGRLTLQELEEGNSDSGYTHQLDPDALLSTTKILYGIRPRGYLLTVEAVNFELGQSLSATVQGSLPQAIRLLEEKFEKILESDKDNKGCTATKREVNSYA